MFELIRSKRSGASLVEILVVIVVFLVGILGVIQVFPKGLSILRTTRNNSVATNLARAEAERLKGLAEQLPDAILPVNYDAAGAMVLDLNRRLDDYVPSSTGLTNAGALQRGPEAPLAEWQRYVGPNVARRVFGEGKVITAPRVANVGSTTDYGSVMFLQFGPITSTGVVVYGGDLNRRLVFDMPTVPFVRDDFQYFFLDTDSNADEVFLPQGAYRNRQYRVAVNAVIDNGTTQQSRSFVLTVPVPVGAPGNRFYQPANLVATIQAGLGGGENVVRLEDDTIRVQRIFEQLLLADSFLSNPAQRDDAAYQVKVIDPNLGFLLFNAQGYNYEERMRNGRRPLQAKVDYDVFDWRIMREDFRVPSDGNPHRLIMGGLKVLNEQNLDGRLYSGLGFPGISQNRDFVLIDLETGGIFDPVTYAVDKSIGSVSFTGNPQILYPGAASAVPAGDIRGRSVRALYMGKADWAVQVTKASSRYNVTYSATLGYQQCYPGLANGSTGLPNRVYFPLSDIGNKVILGEVWYRDGGGNLQTMYDQEFIIKAPQGAVNLAFVDLQDKDPGAVSIDYTNGYGVRLVRGSSARVRVFWNPQRFTLGADPAENLNRLRSWLGGYRRNDTEVFLTRQAVTP